jgi:hypothetical protein
MADSLSLKNVSIFDSNNLVNRLEVGLVLVPELSVFLLIRQRVFATVDHTGKQLKAAQLYRLSVHKYLLRTQILVD